MKRITNWPFWIPFLKSFFLSLVLLCLFFIYLGNYGINKKVNLANGIARSARSVLLNDQLRELQNVVSILGQSEFEQVYYQYEHSGHVFSAPPSNSKESIGVILQRLPLYKSFIELPVLYQKDSSAVHGKFYFIYSLTSLFSFEILWPALILVIFIGMFIPLFTYGRELKRKLSLQQKEQAIAEKAIKYDMAKILAHDIRKPINDLSELLDEIDISKFSAENKLIKNKLQSIQDTAEEFLKNHRVNGAYATIRKSMSANDLITGIFLEERKKLLRHGILLSKEIIGDNYGKFIYVSPSKFKNIIQNAIANAKDALLVKDKALNLFINIKLDYQDTRLVIEICDNGKGLESDKIASIFVEGVSFKKNGNGIALSSAKKYLHEWGGEINFKSEYDRGSTLNLSLPYAFAPNWFLPGLFMHQNKQIVLIDDDPSSHEFWMRKLDGFQQRLNLKLHHFNSLTEANAAMESWSLRERKDLLFLVDCVFSNSNQNGCDFITKWNIQAQSILVTDQADTQEVIQFCEDNKVKLLSKADRRFVPLFDLSNDYTVALLDDDATIREAWYLKAQAKQIKLQAFSCVDDLDRVTHHQKNMIFLLDSELGTQIKGEEFARKLFEQGHRLPAPFLITGHDRQHFENPYWLGDILEKRWPALIL